MCIYTIISVDSSPIWIYVASVFQMFIYTNGTRKVDAIKIIYKCIETLITAPLGTYIKTT